MVRFNQDHDSMEMVGHHNEFINFNGGEFMLDFPPPSGDHPTCIAQKHPRVLNVTQ
jgi:hypothetical protein